MTDRPAQDESRSTLLLVGDAPLAARGADLVRVRSTGDAVAAIRRGGFDLLVVPRELPVADRAPLAELAGVAAEHSTECVQLLGVWCEGEERTGLVVDGFERVFWHAWSGWWSRWLAARRHDASPRDALDGAVVGVVADADAFSAIGDLLAVRGARCVSLGDPAGDTAPRGPVIGRLDAIVWNGSQLGGLEAERFRRAAIAARAVAAPVVALLDFPRRETVAAARAIGAAAVIGKPCDGDLFADSVVDAITSSKPAAGFARSSATVVGPVGVEVARQLTAA